MSGSSRILPISKHLVKPFFKNIQIFSDKRYNVHMIPLYFASLSLSFYATALPCYEKSWEAYQEGRYEEALTFLDQKKPDEKSELLRAVILRKKSRSEEALELLNHLKPSPPQILEKALCQIQLKAYSEASRLLEGLPSLSDPSLSLRVELAKARAALGQGDLIQAETVINKLPNSFEQELNSEKALLMGELLIKQSRYKEAIEYLRQGEAPPLMLAHALVEAAEKDASSLQEQKNLLEEAESLYKTLPASLLSPLDVAQLNHLKGTEEKKGSSPLDNRTQGAVFLLLADQKYRQGERTQDFTAFKAAAELYKEAALYLPEPLREKSLLKEIQALHKAGPAFFKTAHSIIEGMKREGKTSMLLSLLDVENGIGLGKEPGQLASDLKTLHVEPDWKEFYTYLLASLQFKNGELNESLKNFETLLQASPSSPFLAEGLYWGGRILEITSPHDERKSAYFRKFIEQFPEDPRGGEAYYRVFTEQDYLWGNRASLKHLKEFKEKFPDHIYLIPAYYLEGLDALRDRKSPEGRRLSQKNPLYAIECFQKCEDQFEKLDRDGAIPSDERSAWQTLASQATLERAKTNWQIAEESSGAKQIIYQTYAKEVFQELAHRYPSAMPYAPLQEEAHFKLAEIEKAGRNEEKAMLLWKEMEAHYDRFGVTASTIKAKTLTEIGKLYLAKKEGNSALNYFNKAIEASKPDKLTTEETLAILIQKALALHTLGKSDLALTQVSEIINYEAVSPLRLEAMWLRASFYQDLNKPLLARKQLEALASKSGPFAQKAKQALESK